MWGKKKKKKNQKVQKREKYFKQTFLEKILHTCRF